MDKERCMRIHGYCRKEAIAEGELIDVSATAKKAGIRNPTALTREAWERYVKVPNPSGGYTEADRLGNVLAAFRTVAAKAAPLETALFITVWVYDGDEMQYCGLRAVCGPDDDLEPVITIMDSTEF